MLTRSGKVVETELKSLPTSSSCLSDTTDQPSPSSSSSTTGSVTRASTKFWLIGHPSPSITGSKLPDCRQVLKCSKTNQEIGYIVIDAVITFWNMARIKTKTTKNSVLDLMCLWNEWNRLLKNKNRESDAGGKRVNFLAKLDSLFDIGSPDAIQGIMKSRLLTAQKKDGDVAFYLDQKNDRKATMDGHDKIFEIKAKMKEVRYNRKVILRDEEKERVEKEGGQDDQDDEDMEVNDEESNINKNIAVAEVDIGLGWDLNYKPLMNRRSEFVTHLLPKRIMQCEEIASAADRLNFSDNKTTMIVSALIKAAGGNLDDFDISRSTCRRSRMLNRQRIAESVIDNERLNPPQFGALHWDGKLLKAY